MRDRNTFLATAAAPIGNWQPAAFVSLKIRSNAIEGLEHGCVHHAAKEFARDDVTSNTVEGMFGIFKRGTVGIYQHCGEQHLQRYLDEIHFQSEQSQQARCRGSGRVRVAAHSMNEKRLIYRWTEAG